ARLRRVHAARARIAPRHGHPGPRRRARIRSGRRARSPAPRQPAEGQRPRHLPDPQLHGRTAAAAGRRRRHGSRDGQAGRRHRAAGVTAARTAAPDPVFLATAVEIVLRAGEIQMAGRETGFRVAKKGAIDLVTEVDLACERMCRAMLAERFPAHDILAEELSTGPGEAARARYRWVFDPVDGTTNYAHGLPVFCASLALELDGRPLVGAIYDPSRRELFTAEVG